MIYLLGGSGYVGSAFRRHFRQRGVPHLSISRRDVNYYHVDSLIAAIREARPSFLINAAGFTGRPNVDSCESCKHECLLANAVLPGLLAVACEATNLPWGHVSSGCLYQGMGPEGKGFSEDDPPNFCFRHNNCSFYSGTKALGEEVLAGRPHVYIWRPRMPFNEINGPRNYLSKIMTYDRLLKATNSLSHLDEFVRASVECWDKRVPFGIYHMTNPGHISTDEVVSIITTIRGSSREFNYFADEEAFLRQVALTPRSSCCLRTEKLASTGISMSEVRESIGKSLRHWKE